MQKVVPLKLVASPNSHINKCKKKEEVSSNADQVERKLALEVQ
jgi:hypothetical protein